MSISSLNASKLITDYLQSDYCKQVIVASSLIAIHGNQKFVEVLNYLNNKPVTVNDLNNFLKTSDRAYFAYEQRYLISPYLVNFPCIVTPYMTDFATISDTVINASSPQSSFKDEAFWANIAEKAIFEIMQEVYLYARFIENDNIEINKIERVI